MNKKLNTFLAVNVHKTCEVNTLKTCAYMIKYRKAYFWESNFDLHKATFCRQSAKIAVIVDKFELQDWANAGKFAADYVHDGVMHAKTVRKAGRL